MAKAAASRLKVFQTQIGFFDTVVAVTSKQAALRAWGTRQNLFTGGDAMPAMDEAAVAAALKHPGVVLRRAAGSNAPFEVEPGSLPDVPKSPDKPADKNALKSAGLKPEEPKPAEKKPPPADRSGLDRAEAALHNLEAKRKREEDAFEHEQKALDERRRAARKTYEHDTKLAQQAISDERRHFRNAGGKA